MGVFMDKAIITSGNITGKQEEIQKEVYSSDNTNDEEFSRKRIEIAKIKYYEIVSRKGVQYINHDFRFSDWECMQDNFYSRFDKRVSLFDAVDEAINHLLKSDDDYLENHLSCVEESMVAIIDEIWKEMQVK